VLIHIFSSNINACNALFKYFFHKFIVYILFLENRNIFTHKKRFTCIHILKRPQMYNNGTLVLICIVCKSLKCFRSYKYESQMIYHFTLRYYLRWVLMNM